MALEMTKFYTINFILYEMLLSVEMLKRIKVYRTQIKTLMFFRI